MIARLGRLFTLVSRLVTAIAIVALAAVAFLTWDAFFNAPEGTTKPHSPSTERSNGKDAAYANLEIFEGPSGSFAGRVTLRNNTTKDQWMFIDVEIYDGEQHVGEVSGTVTLKPRSESLLELDGYDEFIKYTDSRVHLSGIPR